MARQNIGIGSAANDGNGDTLRQAGTKINANFAEVYALLGGGDSSSLSTQISLENDAVVFEGSTPNDFETRLKVTDPTADRVVTIPNATGTIVFKDTTDTLTNKTLTAPVISTISNTGTLTLPTSTDTLVGRATSDTLTNKTLTAPIIEGGTIGNSTPVTITKVDNIQIDANTISTTNTNGNLSLTPNGTGSVEVAKAAFSSQTRTTNGAASTSATFIIGNKGSALAVSLADGTTVGEYKIFTNKGAGAMTVTPTNFAQGTDFELAQNEGCTCIWDGTNWFLVGNQSTVTIS